ncbi:MAG TPA: cache domain-containing protein, partial [Sulfuricurvum sp.]|nr:cache domain-containing protein [Sulfuricurvum sp.]
MMRWLKRKSLFYTVLYVLIMGIIGAILYTRYEILTEKYTQRHIDMFDQRIESYQLMQQRMLDSYFHLFLESPQIALIMEEASRSEPSVQAVLRRELMGRTEEMFRALQGFDVRLLFFHLPGSVGFLRVHEPEKFGDSLAASRPSVLLAQNSQKKVVTFETGKLFDGFRTIYPLFHHGKFVGTVELAYPFAALKNQAMRQSPGAYTFLIKRSVQEGKATSADINKHYEDSLFGSEYLEDKESALHKGAKGYKKGELEALLRYHQTTIQKAFKKGRLQGIKLLYKGSYSLLTLKPVKEIGGEDAAYMVEITPNHTFFADQWNQFVVLVTLIAFLLAVLMWYIYRFNRSVILLEQYKNAIDDSMIVS